jgi:hypothetical protein
MTVVSAVVILPAIQMDVSSGAGKALRAMSFQHVPKPTLSTQIFQRPGEREKVQVVFAQIGDPKIPFLGKRSCLLALIPPLPVT